jgi:hypothetical protein
MHSERNNIHMFCSIQTHRHIDTSNHENIVKHKSFHTSCHSCHTSFVVDVMGLYTHYSYICSANVALNIGLTFNINDFIPCSCSSFLILIMILLSTHIHHITLYASLSLFQIYHENINLNSFEII